MKIAPPFVKTQIVNRAPDINFKEETVEGSENSIVCESPTF